MSLGLTLKLGALAAAMLYGGNSVYQSNISTQQKLIDSIDRMQGD